MTPYNIEIDNAYVPPVGPITDNATYVNFVMNMAAQSYKRQYETPTSEDGITAAREAYNSGLSPE